MTPVYELLTHLQTAFPTIKLSISRPAKPTGVWFLDIDCPKNPLTVQWQEGRPWGLFSSNTGDYGEAPDEAYPDLAAVEARIHALLHTGRKPRPPRAVRLRELRQERRLSQVELASRLKIQQAAVSKLERRTATMRLDTLRAVIEAMGGMLVVKAVFPDGSERAIRLDREEAEDRNKSLDHAIG